MREIPDSFDPAVVAAIDVRLAAVEASEQVSIPVAIESGSRAWGFPSVDSDYDCRFIYLRRAERYLSLWPPRDVIETPLDAVLDVSGWDLGKLIRLMVKGNAVAIEWLQSPIRYRDDPGFRERLCLLAEQVSDRASIRRHYWHLGRAQWARLDRERGSVPLKKLFYALRPAASLGWLDHHPGAAVAPMHLSELLEQQPLADGLAREVERLIALKSATREMGQGPVPPALAGFIESAFAAFRDEPAARDVGWRREIADQAFRDLVASVGPG